jgi:hypothetical protein
MLKRLRAIIEAGGGYMLPHNFISEVPAFGAKKKYYVLFNSPATGSTLALPVCKLTAEKVRQHIKESNLKFGIKE